MEIPVITFRSSSGTITWRVGDPYVTVADVGAEPYRESDWWRAARRGPHYTLSCEDQAILDLIHDKARFYGPNPMDEHHTVHLMEHLLLCAQGDEDAHSVHRYRGGYGPFWYTVWAALRGLPIPTPPTPRGCCYPISAIGPSETCDGCGREIAGTDAPAFPI